MYTMSKSKIQEKRPTALSQDATDLLYLVRLEGFKVRGTSGGLCAIKS